MKHSLLIAAFLLSTTSHADTYVNGYQRRDGTYVQGHYRTSPNNTKLDNYSTYGNVNPYTGQQGTVNPYGNQPKHKSGYGY